MSDIVSRKIIKMNYLSVDREVFWERKNIKNINLTIRKDRTIYISSPSFLTRKEIENFLEEKRGWIEEKLQKLESSYQYFYPEKFLTGEQISFLGEIYSLQLILAEEEGLFFDKERKQANFSIKSIQAKKERIFSSLFAQLTEDIFQEKLEKVFSLFGDYKLEKPLLKIRKMKSRWGTCYYREGKIIINRKLIFYPEACLEYVLGHELTHFLVRFHNQDFYDILRAKFPDWQERERLLL